MKVYLPVRVELFRVIPVVWVTMYCHDGYDHLSSLGDRHIISGKRLGTSSGATKGTQCQNIKQAMKVTKKTNSFEHTLPQEGTSLVLPG